LTGQSRIKIRKGKTGEVLVDRKEIREMSEQELDTYKDIAGDGKGKVSRGFLFGVSEEIRPGLWMKAEVHAEITLECDQSEVGMEDGNDLAGEVAKNWALNDLEEAHIFLKEFGGK